MLGGAVRLTDSGLSITEWRPLLGAIPPINASDWQQAFNAYKQIPQFQAHPAISLAEFQTIYWWEWSHRLVGRIIGLAFALPFLFFLLKGWLSKRDIKIYSALLFLGAMQGFIGWFMVQSGLSERVSVAPLRLALHLGLAMVIYGAVVLLILERFRIFNIDKPKLMLVAFVFVQLLLGAMVSGLDGGLIYKDFLWGESSPLTANLAPHLDNAPLWQLIHRLSGWALFLVAWGYFWKSPRREAAILPIFLTCQILLGLLTLFSGEGLFLPLMHQLGGVLCLSAALFLLTEARGQPSIF